MAENANDIEASAGERAQLAGMERSLGYGSCVMLRSYIDQYGDALSRSCSPETRRAFEDVLARAAKAYAIEAEHGEGSLLKLEDPFIRKLSRMKEGGVRLVPLQHIASARRYQGLTVKRLRAS